LVAFMLFAVGPPYNTYIVSLSNDHTYTQDV